MEEAHLPDMRTTQTTEMTLSFAKRVRPQTTPPYSTLADPDLHAVCVSSLMVEEIKRIIKTSEIMKWVHAVAVLRKHWLTLT